MKSRVRMIAATAGAAVVALSQTLIHADASPPTQAEADARAAAVTEAAIQNLGTKCGYPRTGVKVCRMVQKRDNATGADDYRARAWIRDEPTGKNWQVGVRYLTLREPASGAGCDYPGASVELVANPSTNGLFDYDEDAWTAWYPMRNGDIWTLVETIGRASDGENLEQWMTSDRYCF